MTQMSVFTPKSLKNRNFPLHITLTLSSWHCGHCGTCIHCTMSHATTLMLYVEGFILERIYHEYDCGSGYSILIFSHSHVKCDVRKSDLFFRQWEGGSIHC